jgi:hypothetical protein
MTLYVVTAEIPDYWDGGTFGYSVCGVFLSEEAAEAHIKGVKSGKDSYAADHDYEVHETSLELPETVSARP